MSGVIEQQLSLDGFAATRIHIPPSGSKKADRAHPSPPGTGPIGYTCKSCTHCYGRDTYAGKRFYKCDLMRATKGSATDIKLKDQACRRYEVRNEH